MADTIDVVGQQLDCGAGSGERCEESKVGIGIEVEIYLRTS